MEFNNKEFKRYIIEQYDRNKIDDEEFVEQMQQIDWVTSLEIFNILNYEWWLKYSNELLECPQKEIE